MVTLDPSAILVNGQRVQLHKRKWVEVLAFLLKHRESALLALQTEVFAEILPVQRTTAVSRAADGCSWGSC